MLIVAAVALLVFGISVQQLWTRVARANKETPPTIFYFKPINQTEFSFGPKRVVIEDEVAEDGSGELTIRYGEDALVLPISIPVRFDELPGLSSHSDWLQILLLQENQSFDRERALIEREAGVANARCIIVTRHQRPGMDPETFGEVFKSDWQFSFYEFDPAGGFIMHPKLGYPESDRAFARRLSRAKREGKPAPERSESELKAGTWEFHAAMFVMPKGSGPGGFPTRPALEAVSWTLPTASVSLVVAVFCIAMAFAPSREDVNR